MVKKRDLSIDYMKIILVVTMIICHTISYCQGAAGYFAEYTNLTTFSGFMFAFGYACNLAYLKNDVVPYKKIVKNALRTLLCYYVSAFCWRIFVKGDFSLSALINTLTTRELAGCSEFLISWVYIYLVILVLFPVIKRVIQNKYMVILWVFVSLVSSFVHFEVIDIFWLAPIFNTGVGCYFPLLQYSGYFIVGAYISHHIDEINYKALAVVAVMGTGTYMLYRVIMGVQPQRWSCPSLLWIVGGYLPVLLIFAACKKFSSYEHRRIDKVLLPLGQNTLEALLISNVFCFVAKYSEIYNWGFPKVSLIICYVCAELLCFYWLIFTRKMVVVESK